MWANPRTDTKALTRKKVKAQNGNKKCIRNLSNFFQTRIYHCITRTVSTPILNEAIHTTDVRAERKQPPTFTHSTVPAHRRPRTGCTRRWGGQIVNLNHLCIYEESDMTGSPEEPPTSPGSKYAPRLGRPIESNCPAQTSYITGITKVFAAKTYQCGFITNFFRTGCIASEKKYNARLIWKIQS